MYSWLDIELFPLIKFLRLYNKSALKRGMLWLKNHMKECLIP
ncbi:hypothetical protein HPGAM_01195 [Helicobacter pylori Gambia94/24]|nr:hypothetical protein HPGAM_01195 [Helicobacter pylori Gambia94/24]